MFLKQTLKDLLSKMGNNLVGDEWDTLHLELDSDGLPSFLNGSPGQKRKLAKHVSNESNVSVDSDGLPTMLSKASSTSGCKANSTSKLFEALQLSPKKRPAASVNKKSAPVKPLKKLVPISLKDRIAQRPNGCSKCRRVKGCTPSCWKVRGYDASQK